MKLTELIEGKWYGFDAYDGCYHYFINKGDVTIYLDTFGDCSCIFDMTRLSEGSLTVLSSYASDPESFEVDVLVHLTQEEFMLYDSDHDDAIGTFIEMDARSGFNLFEEAFNQA